MAKNKANKFTGKTIMGKTIKSVIPWPAKRRHDIILNFILSISLAAFFGYAAPLLSNDFTVTSPDGNVQFKVLLLDRARLGYEVTFKGKSVIDKSPLGITVDNLDLDRGVKTGKVDRYEINETYPWRGVHSKAVNHCNGAKFSITHSASKTTYILDIRAFNDGIAFSYVVPGKENRTVQSEATSFVIPEGSTVWYHDFYMHYEGIHAKKSIAAVKADDWVAPPLTFKLPNDAGYASITESAIINYSGMGLQANGQRSFQVRLGHEVPASYPYILRYKEDDAKRLTAPAAMSGTIKTPWRIVTIGADLNVPSIPTSFTILRLRLIKTFPEGFASWLKPAARFGAI
jgi:alpha-glucosidase